MIRCASVYVPVAINAVAMSGSVGVLLFRDVIFIEVMPVGGSIVPLLEAHLALPIEARLLSIGVGRALSTTTSTTATP
jgi:hypothetical protein